MRLLLVRHGESVWNSRGMFQGQAGVGLSDQGHEEAAATAAWLARWAGPVARVVHSDLDRCAETAGPLARALGCPSKADQRLREADLGWWSGLTEAEITDRDAEGLRDWRSGGRVAAGGGETWAAVRARVWELVAELAESHASETVVAVTHGGSIRVAVAEALRLPPDGHARLTAVGNCSITSIEQRDGGWRLRTYNQVAHLRP